MKTNLLIAIIMGCSLVPALADNVAASPKLREMLDSHRIVAASPTTVSTVRPANDGIVASPKLRETLDAQKTVPSTATHSSTVAKRDCCSKHEIAASPRLQEMWPQMAGHCCGVNSCVIACAAVN